MPNKPIPPPSGETFDLRPPIMDNQTDLLRGVIAVGEKIAGRLAELTRATRDLAETPAQHVESVVVRLMDQPSVNTPREALELYTEIKELVGSDEQALNAIAALTAIIVKRRLKKNGNGGAGGQQAGALAGARAGP